MTEIFNVFRYKATRRLLRNRPTYAENKLWYFLRLKNMGVKFRRQYGIGRYVVDFYSPEVRLVIEADGDSHASDEAIRYDSIRQNEIEALGLFVIRFTNADILCNIDAVLEAIQQVIEERKTSSGCGPPLPPSRPSLPPPSLGGESRTGRGMSDGLLSPLAKGR